MPRSDENEPSQPPVKTSAKAFRRPDAATSKPGVAQLTWPAVTSQTIQRTTSPTRHVTSIRSPKMEFGKVQIAPRMESSTRPIDQWPFGSTQLTGYLPQKA